MTVPPIDGFEAVLDVDVVIYGDQPVRLCDAPDAPAVWEWACCPADAPSPPGLVVSRREPGHLTGAGRSGARRVDKR